MAVFLAGAQVAYNGGNFGQVALAAFSSFVMAQAAVDIGGSGFNWQTLGYAAMGGAFSYSQGGKFGHGFVSAGIGGLTGGHVQGIEDVAGRVMVAAVIGGTISELTGCKFANGALYAAFSAVAMAGAEGELGSA